MRAASFSVVCATILLGSLMSQPVGTPSMFRVSPANNPTTPARIELGREMFFSKKLSVNDQVSCATCHDPQQAWSDGKEQAVGIAGFPVGRNSATLCATGLMGRFPGVRQVRSKNGKTVLRQEAAVLSLEERCLGPIENAVEMGDSVDAIVRKLRRVSGLSASFDRAFGSRGKGVTKERLGKVLAAFLRSIEPDKRAPYRRWLEGNDLALNDAQRRGLDIFNGRGKCNRCHSGPALTDGLVHVTEVPGGPRTRARTQANARRFREVSMKLASQKVSGRKKRLLEAQARVLRGSGNAYYGPNQQVGGQTPTLWNVTRSGPYFRDGSEQDLRRAVTTHIGELQKVALTERQRVRIGGRGGLASRITAPVEIRKQWGKRGPPLPDDLTKDELADLLAFLQALAP